MPKNRNPQEPAPEATQAQPPEQSPPTPEQATTVADTAGTTEPVEAAPDNPISFADPVSPTDLVAGTGDTPDAAIPLLTDEQLSALQKAAHNDDTKRDFTLKVLAAREAHKVQEPAPPPPLAPRMAEQTNAELAAGRAMNAHHAGLQSRRSPPVPEQNATAVFRPADYVPNQRKGQGYVQGRGI